jgi:hypothetical protein
MEAEKNEPPLHGEWRIANMLIPSHGKRIAAEIHRAESWRF